jgi:hypothetical protein
MGVFTAALLATSGCEPGVEIAWQKEFDGEIDQSCIESAFKMTGLDFKRRSYVSEGRRGFPEGISVTQYSYSDPTGVGAYNLDIGLLPTNKTAYHHSWGKVGRAIDPQERSKVLGLLNRVNDNVASACGLSFAHHNLHEPQ